MIRLDVEMYASM